MWDAKSTYQQSRSQNIKFVANFIGHCYTFLFSGFNSSFSDHEAVGATLRIVKEEKQQQLEQQEQKSLHALIAFLLEVVSHCCFLV